MVVTAAPFAPIKVIFEIRIGLGNFDQVLDGRGMERRSSEIGVDDDTRRIDDATKTWPGLAFKLSFEEGVETVQRKEGFVDLGWASLMEKFLPQLFQAAPDRFDHHVSGIGFDEVRDLRMREDFIDTGDLAKHLLTGRWRHWASSS
jgi:hypothetical protein